MAHLLSGSSDGTIAENARSLRRQGYSETEALARANKFAKDSEDSTPTDVEDSDDSDSSRKDSTRQFVIVTKDFSGLGWAKKLQEEGETVTVATDFEEEDDPELRKQMKKVGTDWIDVLQLSEAFNTLRTDQTYWIFTENNFPQEADRLRRQGQKVFGTSMLSEKLEHDRQYATQVAKDAGLPSPPTHEFSTRQEGLAFLDQHTDKAYVFKPDDGKYNFMTFIPVRQGDKDANRELYVYLEHMKKEPGTYILQERIPVEDALEVNAEVWLYEGEPFLATMGLEVKRKNTYDLGEMCGCGGDFVQFIPLDSELVKQTIGKLLPFYKKQKYTGFADVNVIFTKDGEPHFLEVCDRFGYNAQVTMFLALAKDGFGNIMADYMDGHVDDIAKRFRTDIGCSMTLFIDHPVSGLPVHVDEDREKQFYPFDGYKANDQLLLTGYSDEIGVYVDHGETIEAAAHKVWNQVVFDEAVSFPGMYYRSDLWKDDYYNSPLLRYRELKKRKLL